jgi:hypothetical protein
MTLNRTNEFAIRKNGNGNRAEVSPGGIYVSLCSTNRNGRISKLSNHLIYSITS